MKIVSSSSERLTREFLPLVCDVYAKNLGDGLDFAYNKLRNYNILRNHLQKIILHRLTHTRIFEERPTTGLLFVEVSPPRASNVTDRLSNLRVQDIIDVPTVLVDQSSIHF